MKVITNKHAKSIKIRGGEVIHRNDNIKLLTLEAMHAHVKNVHVIDKMRLRKEDGLHEAHRKVQVPLILPGIRQDGLLLVPQPGGAMETLNAEHQRILIRKEDILYITGLLSSL